MSKRISTVGLVGSVVVAACAGAQEYEVRELPGLSTFFIANFARDIADDGSVVGDSLNNTLARRAVVWAPDGTVADLGTGADSAMSQARAVSPGGALIAGDHRNPNGATEAANWDAAHTLTFLGSLAPDSGGRAFAINDSGLAVGDSRNAVGLFRPVKYENGAVVELADNVGAASDVNSAAQIVGWVDTVDGQLAMLWEGTGSTILTSLGDARQSAAAINESGVIVGSALHPDDSKLHAVVWDNGAIQDLGLYQDLFPTAALDINDAGVIVGTATMEFASGRTTALIWRNGVAEELNNLIPPGSGWDLLVASAINGSGQIVGWGERDAGRTRAFILTPLPCAADRTGDGTADVFDLLDYLGLWFAGAAEADIDGAPGVDVFDLLAYLDLWFAGCE